MKCFKRAIVNIVRQPSKSLILFLTILILGIFASSAISIVQAIRVTEANLLRRIPPIASVDSDLYAMREYAELHGYWPSAEEAVTRELLETIGNLPYVRVFDFTVYDWFFSQELVYSDDVTPYLEIDWFADDFTMAQFTPAMKFNSFNVLRVNGIRNSAVTSLEEGIIELIEGRTFTQAEMEEGSLVVLISQAFANANQLSLGSTFVLESHIYETFNPFLNIFCGAFDYHSPDAALLEVHDFEFEVIGIFTPTVELKGSVMDDIFMNHVELNMRLYVPISAVESRHRLLDDYIQRFHPEALAERPSPIGYHEMIFALYDSLDLANFYEAASALLPNFWLIDDFRSEFAAMSTSLANLQGISNGIVIGVSIASVLILGLLILLLLHDRKGEIGIYLALGESRKNMIKQTLIEMLLISMIALSLSLFVGNIIAREMTHSILHQELHDHQLTPLTVVRNITAIGFSIQMTTEEMLAAYDVTLNGMTILMFAGVAIVMITLSTILPIVYLTRLKPKDILIKSSIG